tara:strand:+ start:3493 stop:3894 length:402 start_codon:yes stop_codon:yes gene_type:complete
MAVSILTLKTGDRVIAELKEIFDEEGADRKGICLLMEEPYVLHLDGSTPQFLTEAAGAEYQIRFSKWNPYSSDWQYKIPYDSVMTISNPEPGLEEAYNNKITEKRDVYGQNDRNTTTPATEDEPQRSPSDPID